MVNPIKGAANLNTQQTAALDAKKALVKAGLPLSLIQLMQKDRDVPKVALGRIDLFAKKLGFENRETLRSFLALHGYGSLKHAVKDYLAGKFEALDLLVKHGQKLNKAVSAFSFTASEISDLKFVSGCSSRQAFIFAMTLDKQFVKYFNGQLANIKSPELIKNSIAYRKQNILMIAKAVAQIRFYADSLSYKNLSNKEYMNRFNVKMSVSDPVLAKDFSNRQAEVNRLMQSIISMDSSTILKIADKLSAHFESQLVLPVDGRFLTSTVDPNRSLFGKGHNGMDYDMPIGTPCRSNVNGVISSVTNTYTGGKVVIIDTILNGQPHQIKYLHLSKNNMFEKGQKVLKGQVIGLSGNTGAYTTGPHLHYEISVLGKPKDINTYHPPVNQLALLTKLVMGVMGTSYLSRK